MPTIRLRPPTLTLAARCGVPCPAALLLLTALLGFGAPAAPAQAQEAAQQAATARLLFKRGVEQGDAGDWAAASDSFRRALALRESVVIRYNLAHALQQVGRLVEASEHFRAVQQDPESDRDLVKGASAALEEIEPRLATLTVQVDGAPEGSQVAVDDTVLLPVQLGAPMPADPGEHEATLSLEGETLASEKVTLEEAGSADVQLVYVPTPAEAAATVPIEPAAAPEHDGMPRRKKRWIIGVSAAVAVVAAAVIVGVTAAGGDSGSGVSRFMPGEITLEGAN